MTSATPNATDIKPTRNGLTARLQFRSRRDRVESRLAKLWTPWLATQAGLEEASMLTCPTKAKAVPHFNPAPRQVRLFRNNRNQAIRILVEFELPGSEATLSRDGDRLLIEPVRKKGLAAVLDCWEPLDEEVPEIDDLPPGPKNIF